MKASLRLNANRIFLQGSFRFDTVAPLECEGVRLIKTSRNAHFDLSGVTAVDSSVLSLLIRWYCVAKKNGIPFSIHHAPTALFELARLYELQKALPFLACSI